MKNSKKQAVENVEEDSFASRVKAIRKSLDLTQEQFAAKLKLSGPSLSEIEAGKYKPCHDFFLNMILEFKVNLYYLFLGTGEMFLDPSEFAIEFVEVSNYSKDLIYEFRRSRILQCLLLGSYFSIKNNNKDKESIEKEVYEFEQKKTGGKSGGDKGSSK